jgi:transposase-like protein
MDPTQQYCDNDECPDRGKISQGNIKVYSYQERRYYCISCGRTFSASRDQIFYRLHTPRQDFIEAVGLLAERCSLRGIARVKGVKPDTVLHWLDLAGQQATTVSHELIRHLHLTQVQIDELWTFVKKSRATSRKVKSSPGWVTIGSGPRLPYLRACASPVT